MGKIYVQFFRKVPGVQYIESAYYGPYDSAYGLDGKVFGAKGRHTDVIGVDMAGIWQIHNPTMAEDAKTSTNSFNGWKVWAN